MASEEAPRSQAADGDPGILGVRTITDARTLRALTHPVRLALLEALLLGGAMTATEAAERIGETPTTCSFHLRQLAKYGFVTEAGGGRGRARPWRLTSIGLSFAPGGEPEAEIASAAALRLFRERQFARYEEWQRTKGSYPREWQEASSDSAYIAYLTPQEFKQMNAELTDLMMKWFRLEGRVEDPAKRPPGALPIEALQVSYPIAPPAPDATGAAATEER